MKRFVIMLFCLLVAGLAPAQDQLERAILKTGGDIQKATQELTRLRDTHAKQRVPLSRRLEELQAEVKGLRLEAEKLQQAEQQGAEKQEELETQVQGIEEECRFMFSLLSEYRRSAEVRASRAEATLLSAQLSNTDAYLTEKAAFESLPQAAKALLELAVSWNDNRFGGMVFDGVALDPKGVEHPGRFAVCGPAGYFATADGAVAGLVVARLGSVSASVHDLPGDDAKTAIQALVSGQDMTVPVDVSSGDALKIAAAKKSLMDHAKEGGVVMVPLVILAAWALLLSLMKVSQIRRIAFPAPESLDQILLSLQQNNIQSAQTQVQSVPEPLGPVLAEAIEHRAAPHEHIEEILHERILMIVPVLEKHLGTLAVFGGVAPLLGLLGTVTGMIHTFQLVTIFGTGDAKLLSGGISEALVTTEFGLIIAIPVLLVHAYLARRIRSLIADLEQVAADFVARLKEKESA